MRSTLRAARAAAVVAGVLTVLWVGSSGPVTAAPPTVHTARAGDTPSPLEVSLVQMTPWTPAATDSQQPFTITVELHNTTDAAIDHVALRLGRAANPVTLQSQLTSADPTTLPTDLLDIREHPATPHTIDVPAGASVQATFTTTTGIDPPYRLCLCANAVYPLYLSAVNSGTGALDGFVATYVAAVDKAADRNGNPFVRTGVAWVWPLVDRPHRLLDGRVFTDDALAAEVESGGRLDRALQVVEGVENSATPVPMTLMIDPELVDELTVMAGGHYSYLSSTGRTVRGSGAAAAAAKLWLHRLRVLLPQQDVAFQFTPYADPAIQSLTDNGLNWRTHLPPTMLSRVEGALNLQALPSTLSWPPGGVASGRTLNRIAGHGSTSVLLNASDVSPSTTAGVPTSLVSLRTSHGRVTGALLSTAAQDDVARVIDNDHPNLSVLPSLLAQVAVRADDDSVGYRYRVNVLSPPRYVDADPSAAETAIVETSSSAFSTPVALDTVLTASAPSSLERGRVDATPASAANLSLPIVTAAQAVRIDIPGARSLLSGKSASPAALALLAQLPRGLQRIESAAWQSVSGIGRPAGGVALATRLRRQVSGLLSGVRIVRPEAGHYSYTLASTNSPLPITVENTLPYRAFVHIDVTTAAGVPGLTTTDLGVQSIAPQTKQTFRVPAHVQRSGRIQLIASLSTANGRSLGPQVRLFVHSTVFGTIGIVITVIAAIVLFLALAVRYARRLVRLRRKRRPVAAGDPVTSPEPVA